MEKTKPDETDMKGALGIFAKTPGLTPVKTRLGKQCGQKKAETFYRFSIKAIEEISDQVQELSHKTLTPYWAIAEKEGLNHSLWSMYKTIWTEEGSLGNRLNHIYKTLLKDHDYVILIGTDSPQLTPNLIWEAAKQCVIKDKEYVIGPCTDGGFYLFGSNLSISPSIWIETPYSQSHTLTELKKRLKPYQSYDLKTQQDVDVITDLKLLHQTLQTQPLLPKQIELLKWLKTLGI